MAKRKVVITGMGAVSPFGWNSSLMVDGMLANACALVLMNENDQIEGMQAKVAGKAPYFDAKIIPREHRRSMSHMSIMALVAANEALEQAGIKPGLPLAPEYCAMGSSIASTISSANALEDFFSGYLISKDVTQVRSTVFFKVMSHAVPSNLSVSLGLTGRCLSPSSACAGGLQALGMAYESILAGREKRMICGGAEEFHGLFPATFDRLGAATHNPDPDTAAKPFDATRDGIVCSEGAGVFVLEDAEAAAERGAEPIAEVLGFHTNSSPLSIVSPDTDSIVRCMNGALIDAGLKPADISLVNAHATSTEHGDIAEGNAIAQLFGNKIAVNSLKGYMGHTMAASGAVELIATLKAAKRGKALGTRNLTSLDPRCGDINVFAASTAFGGDLMLKNSFGLGGVNASLVLKML
ncbi:beta-ketoacyl-[acyl-carrier-protein] synthase family protein [Desulfovibrio sp. OttesenSCG-928-F07]|nr:beta-ketoacyl-[acyl-carrier-protein] synthase family protein [Desulfovibrio sp. OttesenSCG-928-F07]